MRVITWNLERRKTDAPYGKRAIKHLFSQNPDVMAVSETRTNFPTNDGHTIWARPPQGLFEENERKILIWSKNPWTDVDDSGDERLPIGRFISGVTKTDIGEVRVVGVCIPYHMADVVHGTQDKKPWEHHKTFLDVLPSILKRYERPVVIAGDFNQQFPRVKYGNHTAALKMEEAFRDYQVVTQGVMEGMSRAGIDHIAIDKRLAKKSVWGWPYVVDGTRLSDLDWAVCELVLER
ncbi:MAG: endonuclease/exonuclease/phosphatase family protein [Alphaproteobacteria bacterium]